MIFRYLFKWKSFLIFLFFLYVLSNIIVNADDSNELRVDNNNKREVLPESNTPAERAEIVEVAKVADQVDEKAEVLFFFGKNKCTTLFLKKYYLPKFFFFLIFSHN